MVMGSWSYLSSLNLSNVDKIGNFCVVFTYSIKREREIRKFHVAVVQRRLKYVQKSVMHVQSCCFENKNPSPFRRSRCRRLRRCSSSLLLWSRNLAIMVTSPLYCVWKARALGSRIFKAVFCVTWSATSPKRIVGRPRNRPRQGSYLCD